VERVQQSRQAGKGSRGTAGSSLTLLLKLLADATISSLLARIGASFNLSSRCTLESEVVTADSAVSLFWLEWAGGWLGRGLSTPLPSALPSCSFTSKWEKLHRQVIFSAAWQSEWPGSGFSRTDTLAVTESFLD